MNKADQKFLISQLVKSAKECRQSKKAWAGKSDYLKGSNSGAAWAFMLAARMAKGYETKATWANCRKKAA